MTFRSLVWLRDDLRLADNPALNAAVAQGGRVAALYMLEQAPGLRPLGGVSTAEQNQANGRRKSRPLAAQA